MNSTNPMDEIEFTIARIECNAIFYELYVKNHVALLTYPQIDRVFHDTMSIRQILYESFGPRTILFEGDSIDLPVSQKPLCNIIIQ